jgi:D-3-phosphoglycerate dehydrogenase
MRIAVLDDYQDAFGQLRCGERLAGHAVTVFSEPVTDLAAIAQQLQGFEVLLMTQQRSTLRRPLIEQLPALKLVSLTGRNASHVDVEACTERGIAVCVASGVGNPSAPAELAWGLVLASLRHIPEEVHRLKSGRWSATVGVGLAGKTLGVYAYGRIGSLVARYGTAFGMRVVCWGREGSLARARAAGYEVAGSRQAFFAEADVVSLHLPMRPETRGIVTAADLALMKPTALLVNVSRAGLIEKGALARALEAGRPGRAAVDVYEREPVLDASDPLVRMDNVVCTPHLGYVEWSTYEAYYGGAVDNIVAFAAGRPTDVINPQALPA